MDRYLKVSDDAARLLFNELITWDIYGDVSIDNEPVLRAFVEVMSDIVDYEQPLQPSLIVELRPVLSVLAQQGMVAAGQMLDAVSSYPTADVIFFPEERQDVQTNYEAIGAFRARRLQAAESH